MGHAIAPCDDQAQGEAMFPGQWRTMHLVAEQVVGVQRLLERHAAGNCSVIVKSSPPLPSGTILPERPGPSTPELSRIVTSTADAIPGWLNGAVPVLDGRRPLQLNAGAV
jgi:hypothetical protein